jgi:hypothetical protein
VSAVENKEVKRKGEELRQMVRWPVDGHTWMDTRGEKRAQGLS